MFSTLKFEVHNIKSLLRLPLIFQLHYKKSLPMCFCPLVLRITIKKSADVFLHLKFELHYKKDFLLFFYISACVTGRLMKGFDGMAQPVVVQAILFIVALLSLPHAATRNSFSIHWTIFSIVWVDEWSSEQHVGSLRPLGGD